jgi:hypothetical protein
MGYKVKHVSNSRDLKDFIQLPFEIYRNDKLWVPPIRSELRRTLNPRKNPYFKNASLKLFNSYKDDKITSRAAVVINSKHFEKFGTKTAFFGFFESYNDKDSVRNLFNEIEKYCRNNDIEIIEGPFNPNHYSELGMQINNFNKPVSFFQTYNPPYYNELLVDLGFSISSVIHTRRNCSFNDYFSKTDKKNHQDLKLENFSIRPFNLKKMEEELESLREIYNDAFNSNCYFLNVSKEEYLFAAKYLKLVSSPELIQFVEYKGKPVGVFQCVLNINPLLKKLNGKIGPVKYLRFLLQRKKIKEIIIYAVGIKKTFQRSAVYLLLLNKMIETAEKYEVCETTWISKENIFAVRAAERLGLKSDKEFALYSKKLNL